jgi:transcriptional regulator with XRE-family HTH domain
MFQIGASLREARTRRGLSAADVQRAIRIRERYLTALEEEKWDLLPGEAYAKGFLRTYAEFLGLDADLYLDEWNSRFAHPDEVPAPEPPPSRGRRPGALRPLLAGLAIAVAIAGAAAWKLGSDGTSAHRQTNGTGTTAAQSPIRKPPPPAPPARPVYAVFRAARGNCWLLVRRSDAAGQILYEQTLAQGSSVRLPVGRALWVRVGAPWNLDVTVAGHAVAGLPTAPANVLVSKSGIAAA